MSNLGQKKIIYYISENALTSLNDNNGLKIFKNEIISFLKEKRYNRIDFKSVGALFGLGYYSDNAHMVDILVHFEYDFYKIRQFLSELLTYICDRQIITNKNKEEIVSFYSSNSIIDITVFMNKYNDMHKFKIFKSKLWIPLSSSSSSSLSNINLSEFPELAASLLAAANNSDLRNPSSSELVSSLYVNDTDNIDDDTSTKELGSDTDYRPEQVRKGIKWSEL